MAQVAGLTKRRAGMVIDTVFGSIVAVRIDHWPATTSAGPRGWLTSLLTHCSLAPSSHVQFQAFWPRRVPSEV